MNGQIYTWSLLGYGFVLANKKDLYFLHHSDIKEGMDEMIAAVKENTESNHHPQPAAKAKNA